MATSLPKVHIPVTVTTEGVDKGLSQVEEKMRRAAARMKRLGGTAAGGPQKGGGFAAAAPKATAFLGGVGKLGPAAGLLGGLGAAGAALAAPLAAFGMASQQVALLAQMTKGATEALATFKATGEQTFAANSVILERLARLESGAQLAAAVPGVSEAFAIGGARPGEKSIAQSLTEFASEAAAFAGATLSGKTFEQSLLEAQLVTASEAQAKEIAAQIAQLEKDRFDKPMTLLQVLFENNLAKLDRIAIELGKL